MQVMLVNVKSFFDLKRGEFINYTGLICLLVNLGDPNLLLACQIIPSCTLYLLLINYNIMLNNYTDSSNIYHPCNVILPASSGMGELLIGDFNSATDGDLIKAHNIKTIITAAAGMEHLQVPVNILHITFPLLDAKTQDIKQYFQDSYTVIKANLPKGGVLVHCAAGVSRSATLVIAYLIKSRKISFREAIGIVRAKRKSICPNLGFQRQLKQYQKDVFQGKMGKVNLKKAISQKISQERKTSYNHFQIKNIQQLPSKQPKTADHSIRKKIEGIRKPLNSYSQSRPRDRKNFKVRSIHKQLLFVYGHGQGLKQKQSLRGSEKIQPPIIQTHMRNGYPGMESLMMRKNY